MLFARASTKALFDADNAAAMLGDIGGYSDFDGRPA